MRRHSLLENWGRTSTTNSHYLLGLLPPPNILRYVRQWTNWYPLQIWQTSEFYNPLEVPIVIPIPTKEKQSFVYAGQYLNHFEPLYF